MVSSAVIVGRKMQNEPRRRQPPATYPLWKRWRPREREQVERQECNMAAYRENRARTCSSSVERGAANVSGRSREQWKMRVRALETGRLKENAHMWTPAKSQGPQEMTAGN